MRSQPPIALDKASDVVLAALAVQNDRAAFAVLARRASPVVSDLLRRMGAQPTLADDLTQDALIAALRGLAGYRGEAAFGSWVMTIAARLYMKRFRQDARTDVLAEPVNPGAPGPDAEDASQLRLDLDRALTRLTPPERLCVSLCHGAGMTHQEIALGLGVPLGTVKSHVLRGMTKLRTLLSAQDQRREGDADERT